MILLLLMFLLCTTWLCFCAFLEVAVAVVEREGSAQLLGSSMYALVTSGRDAWLRGQDSSV